MPLNILYSKPGHLIRRAHQIAVALFMEECAAYDITPVQYATLVAIRETRGLRPSSFRRSWHSIRLPSARSSNVWKLKKLVSRRMTAADKRAKCLFLTKEGQALLEAVEPAVMRSQDGYSRRSRKGSQDFVGCSTRWSKPTTMPPGRRAVRCVRHRLRTAKTA